MTEPKQTIIPPSMPLDFEERIRALEALASLMDSQWTIPGTKIRIGVDSFIGLLPGIGDTISAFVSSYIIREAHRLGVPAWMKWMMTWNIFVDWLIGIVPFVGDIFDIGWKANIRNVALLKKHVGL